MLNWIKYKWKAWRLKREVKSISKDIQKYIEKKYGHLDD